MKIDAKTATLVGVLVVAVTAIIWVSVVENEVIRLHLPPSLPTPTTVEGIKLTDWIGAIATAAGAVGAVGALWVGAVTLRRQINDQHRGQARAVTVKIYHTPDANGLTSVEIRNDSSLPIYGVVLVATNKKGEVIGQEFEHAMPAGTPKSYDMPSELVGSAYALFQDSAGTKWKRWFNGDLEEQKTLIPAAL